MQGWGKKCRAGDFWQSQFIILRRSRSDFPRQNRDRIQSRNKFNFLLSLSLVSPHPLSLSHYRFISFYSVYRLSLYYNEEAEHVFVVQVEVPESKNLKLKNQIAKDLI